MPIYEYKCNACGHQEEVLQKITEAPLTVCPVCHANAMNKLISETSFQLKGTGWYATDFRDKGKPKVADKATETATDAKPSTDTTSGGSQTSTGTSTDTKSNDKATG